MIPHANKLTYILFHISIPPLMDGTTYIYQKAQLEGLWGPKVESLTYSD